MYNLNDLISMIGFFVIALAITGPYFLGKIICPIVHTINERRSDYSKKSKVFSIAIIWIYSLLTIITDIFILFMMRYIGLFFFYLIAQDFIFILLFIFEYKKLRKRAIKTLLISMIIVSIIYGFYGFISLYSIREDEKIRIKAQQEQYIRDYNSEFRLYFGNKRSDKTVKILAQKIYDHNSTSNQYKIDILFNGGLIDYKDYNSINHSSLYKINVLNDLKSDDNNTNAGYYTDGRIKIISIEEVENEDLKTNEQKYNLELAKKSALESYLDKIKQNNKYSSTKIYIIYKGITYVNNIDELYNLMNENNYYTTRILDRNSSDEKEPDAGFYNDWDVKTIVISEFVEEG